MNADERAALEAAAKAATPGPWMGWTQGYADTEAQVAEIRAMLEKPAYPATDMSHVATADRSKEVALVGNGPRCQENATYIALANPTAILELLAENAALREALVRINAEVPPGAEDRWVTVSRLQSWAEGALSEPVKPMDGLGLGIIAKGLGL